MKRRHSSAIRPLAPLFWLVLVLFTACDAEPSFTSRPPLPTLRWDAEPFPNYGALERDLERAREVGLAGLRIPLEIPSAIEVRLEGADRALWREALAALVLFNQIKDQAHLAATAPWPSTEGCDVAPPNATLPLTWRVEAQRIFQQHRAILWRLGALQIDARGLSNSLDAVLNAFLKESDRSVIEKALIRPIHNIQAQLRAYEALGQAPADWRLAALRVRFAQHRPLLFFTDRLDFRLIEWQRLAEKDARWSHLARGIALISDQTQRWRADFQLLIKIVSSAARQIGYFQRLTQHLPSDSPQYWQCISAHVSVTARSARVIDLLLQMQYQLHVARRRSHDIRDRLIQGRAEVQRGWTPRGILILARLEQHLLDRAEALMGLESEILARWDRSGGILWEHFFPEAAAPLDHPMPHRVDSASTWRERFFKQLRPAFPRVNPRLPEPPQPPRRNKPQSPYISAVIDLARSPSIIGQIEQGLMAMAGLDAQLTHIYERLVEACGGRPCPGMPSARVEHIPRDHTYVATWQGLPVEQRTLGHSLIVLELTRLHLARQTQRLADFHAWLAERSRIDNTSDLLAEWDERWTAYTSPFGIYMKFLRRFTELVERCEDASRPPTHRAISDPLITLLDHQWTLIDLTIDYARFLDRGGQPPAPTQNPSDAPAIFREWSRLQETLLSIETATLARDTREAEAREREAARQLKLEEAARKRAREEAARRRANDED